MKWIDSYLAEAEQLIANNQVEEGMAILNNLLYEEPGYSDLHNHLGWAYLYYGQNFEQAELHLKMAIRFNERFHAPYQHLANMYLRSHRLGEAIHYATQGLEKEQANKVALYELLGTAYELRGEFSKAIKSYKSAILNSMATFEINNIKDGIKRCRKKRVILFFSL